MFVTTLKKILCWNWLQQSWMKVNVTYKTVQYHMNLMWIRTWKFYKFHILIPFSCEIFFEYLIKNIVKWKLSLEDIDQYLSILVCVVIDHQHTIYGLIYGRFFMNHLVFLIRAALGGHSYICQTLIKYGVDPNIRDYSG